MEYYYNEANPAEKDQDYVENLEIQLEYVKEQYSDAVRAMLELDNVGWTLYQGQGLSDVEGFDLEQLKGISKMLREWTDSNPLLLNGWEKRCSYMFGTGYTIDTDSGAKVSQRILSLIDSKANQDAIFSESALATNERARYTDGGLFILWSKSKKVFQRMPFHQIADVATDPDNVEIKWLYKRVYPRVVLDPKTGVKNTEVTTVWYPTDTLMGTPNTPRPTKIGDHQVNYDIVVIDDIVNEHTGNVWGTPDSFTAAPWALAYSAYLRDGTKVLASLAEWAWKVSPKSRAGGDSAAAKIKTGTGAPGGTIVTDMDISSLPRANAVDLSTGRPLAAMVASALGISVVLLLSDPGQSGAFGTAQTLTDPSLRSLLNRQKLNTQFLKRCLKQMGLTNPVVAWAKMNPDADYREQQTLVAALGSGLYHPDEIREPLEKVANITLKHPKEPAGFLVPNNTKSVQLNTIDPAGGPATPAGGVKPDGTTALQSGQGKVGNTAKASYGVNDLRGTGGRAK
jgi:hypothetical protein